VDDLQVVMGGVEQPLPTIEELHAMRAALKKSHDNTLKMLQKAVEEERLDERKGRAEKERREREREREEKIAMEKRREEAERLKEQQARELQSLLVSNAPSPLKGWRPTSNFSRLEDSISEQTMPRYGCASQGRSDARG
jgi:hypothetical protein